jgi:hypothetical protein
MKTKLTFLLLLVAIFILLLKTTTYAQTINFALNVTDISFLADKSVCITNANDLDKETQEKLKLR